MKMRYLALMGLLLAVPCAARTIRVDDDGPADFKTIQAAIDDASDNGDIVLVAPGTYTGDGNRDIDFKGKAITVRSENGPGNCIIDCNGTLSNRHRGFFFHSGESADSALQGFSIKNGSADKGGGVFCEGSSPTISDCIITRCKVDAGMGGRGAGIYCYQSETVIRDCVLSENIAQPNFGRGGGIYCAKGAVTITNCVIENNSETWSGGIHCSEGSPRIYKCTILNNETSGVFCRQSKARIEDCLMTGNWHGIICEFNDSATIEGCIIRGGNALLHPTGIRCSSSSPTIHNCLIAGNGFSGVSIIGASRPIIRSSTITGNAELGLYCGGTSDCTVVNSIFWNNWNDKPLPCQIRVEGNNSKTPSICRISYSSVQGGEEAVCLEDGGVIEWGLGNIDVDPCFAASGHWELDPNNPFADLYNRFIWIDGDYHLKSQAGRWDPNSQAWVRDDVTSPCIDAGDPMSPIGLEPFPNGGRINMGVYGGRAEASKSFLSEPGCEMTESGFVGDIDGVIGVSFGDFALLANYWLDTGAGLIADITDDNDVDYGDLQPLAGNWLCGCDQIQSFSAYPYSVYFGCNPVIADATINSFDPKTVSYFWEYIDELEDTGTIEMAEPNELQNCDEPESCRVIYLTDTEKKRIHAAKTAHSIWLDKNDILAWNIRMYSEDELAGLFDETLLFSRSGSRDYFFSVVDHSPSEVYDYLAGSELLRDDIFSTFYAVLDDLRSDFRHGNTGDGNRNSAYTVREALTTYAANDRRVSRAGCHSMTRIAIALLRSVNIPGEETTSGKWFEAGHSSAVWPTLEYVLPHGDNIYNAFLRATPVDEFLPTLTFYQANLGTKPCEASLVCLSHRHMSLNAIRYPPAWTLDRCCDPTRYGYDDCRDYIYDTHSSYLAAEEMDAAASEIESLCGTR